MQLFFSKRSVVQILVASCLSVAACDCGEEGNGGDSGTGGDSDLGGDSQFSGDGALGGDGSNIDGSFSRDTATRAPAFTELWYSSGDKLVRIEVSAVDGSVVEFESSDIQGRQLGQNLITMLNDGSLLGGRLAKSDNQTHFYHIAEPPRNGSAFTVSDIGVMPGDIKLEALYTDCEGRVYGMDTGQDDGSAIGNRLLRFTGNILSGDFAFVVVSDLASASVADIDDMGPGIDANGKITDNPGFAIDTGTIHDFNYETGSGTEVGSAGSFGVHVLGGSLFDDEVSRLYVLDRDANLFLVDPVNFSVSDSLGVGPGVSEGLAGHGGLAGPLTECETGFVIQ